MKMHANVEVVATIQINQEEALVLEHLCSYDIAKEFASKYSHRLSEERIKEVLRDLRKHAGRIVEAHKHAVENFPRS